MHPRRERLARLERLAKRQEWVVSIDQLRRLEFTADEIRGLVERRYLHRVHRGVYAVGHRQLTRRGWLFAALLACGETSFISHRTAAGMRGLCAMNPYAIHVTKVGTGSRRRSGLIVHTVTREPAPGEVTVAGGLRTSSVPRLFVEMARDESREELDRMIQLAVRKKMLVVPELEEVMSRHPQMKGMARLKAAFAAYRPRPFDKSGLERAVAAEIAADSSIPQPLRNHHRTAGGIDWELDFFWPNERVVLETDGDQYHLTPQDKERDRIKDAKLMAEGITPVRVTEVRWELDRAGVLGDLRAILRQAAR